MPLTPEEFDELVSPWKDAEPPAPLPSADDAAARLEREVRAAVALGDAALPAAIGHIVAVGNYEWLGPRRAAVIEKANALLAEFDPEHSRRWG